MLSLAAVYSVPCCKGVPHPPATLQCHAAKMAGAMLIASAGHAAMAVRGFPQGSVSVVYRAQLKRMCRPPPPVLHTHRSDILQQPGVLGVALAAGTLSAADAAADVWGQVGWQHNGKHPLSHSTCCM